VAVWEGGLNELNGLKMGRCVFAYRDGELLELCNYPNCLHTQCACKDARGENFSLVVETGTTHRPTGHVTVKLWNGLYHDVYQELVMFESRPEFCNAQSSQF
jgi:hypothetical protein